MQFPCRLNINYRQTCLKRDHTCPPFFFHLAWSPTSLQRTCRHHFEGLCSTPSCGWSYNESSLHCWRSGLFPCRGSQCLLFICSWQLSAGTLLHSDNPSNHGTGTPVDRREGECRTPSLPLKVWPRLASDVMESGPVAPGSLANAGCTRLASAP